VTPFAVTLAWREGRASLRRVGLYGLSIAVGVAAMVAVHSFRDDVARSIRTQARVLMGADARFESRQPLEGAVASVVDSLVADGGRRAAVVSTGSMVAASGDDGGVRLLQLRGIEGDWPFYGEVRTEPAGAWRRLGEPGTVLVDRPVLTQLGVELGDTLQVGEVRLAIVGITEDLPTDLAFQTALGPRVWLGVGTLREAGLLTFGSLIRYETFVAVPDAGDLEAVDARYGPILEAARVDFGTARERARTLTRAVGFMGDFLGLIGLGALLLGGIGVASAIHVFVKERLTQVAVLRCIGARQGSIFTAYLLQAAGLGLMGAALGAVVGVSAQQLLPRLLDGLLPVDVVPRIWWGTVAAGVAIGVWVSALFALLPLLAVRDVPPLRALRQSVEGSGRRLDWTRLLAGLVLAVSVVGLSVLEAPEPLTGLVFAGVLVASSVLLWLTGRGIIALSRRVFPAGAPYPVRQGYSNLFRPGNQTVAVTLALGFGAFVVGTVLLVQRTLTRELAVDVAAGQPNLLLFDIQEDQVEPVLDLLPDDARAGAQVTPIVPARLAAVNGRGPDALSDLPPEARPRRWAVRREYRHTWRDTLTDAETLVQGAWWDAAAPAPEGMGRISLEYDLAGDLQVGVGDTLTWQIGGRPVPTVVSSLRLVDWERFQTNFFVVFEPGLLDGAPTTWVALARVPGQEAIARVQRDLVRAHPNVSVLDVSRIREVVEGILARVDQAIRFLAAFSALAGVVVLAGALAATRHQRLREGALLKTLGARRGQLLTVLFSEYVALGLLAAGAGLLLATGAAWGLVTRIFDLSFRPEASVLGAVALGVALVTLVTGFVGSRGLLRRPPLPVLRELND
jgi:putative ABC transport system permease protein